MATNIGIIFMYNMRLTKLINSYTVGINNTILNSNYYWAIHLDEFPESKPFIVDINSSLFTALARPVRTLTDLTLA